MTDLLSILIIEKNPDDFLFFKNSLIQLKDRGAQIQIRGASTLKEALNALIDPYDIILVNLHLPDSKGLETLTALQKKTEKIPIIIIGEKVEDATIREAIRLGAQDFLPKADLDDELILRIIHYAIERNRSRENLKAISYTDELTGVYNRRGFFALTQNQISLSQRMKKGFYLFAIDLDYLKQINDTFGHLAGDRALVGLANCLRTAFRKHDIIGRMGGDEFSVIVVDVHQEDSEELKKHLMDRVREYNLKSHEPFSLSFGFGKAYYDGSYDVTLDTLLQIADTELYQEKKQRHSHQL